MTSIIISIASLLIAICSVSVSAWLSYHIHKSSSSSMSYLDIDRQYSDLLRLGLYNPDLRDYDKASSYYRMDDHDKFVQRYNIYAYMCWNLVETIYDMQKERKADFRMSRTWLPVMYEENRLHYTWFKHNIDKFKPDFQEFVIGSLNEITIVEGTVDDLKYDVYPRFEKDFPVSERIDIKHLTMLMLNGKYKLLLAKHKVFKETIGYAFIYTVDEYRTLWLDYMAISKRFQNAGYGTLLFNKFVNSRKDAIGVFMEIEIPNSPDEATLSNQKKRIEFYKRLGARPLNINYQLPTNEGGVPMYLYFKPSTTIKLLPKEKVMETIASAFKYIHSDVPDSDKILESFINDIEDEYLDADKKNLVPK